MSAEIRPYSISERPTFNYEVPFPIDESIAEHYVKGVKSELTTNAFSLVTNKENIYFSNIEAPLREGLNTVAKVRKDVFLEFEFPAYVIGATFSRSVIHTQMNIRDITHLEDEQMDFAKSAFMREFFPHLQPSAYPHADVISAYLDQRERIFELDQPMVENQALILFNPSLSHETLRSAFANEQLQRDNNLRKQEPGLIIAADQITEGLTIPIQDSFRAGVGDVHLFYSSYFKSLNQQKTA